MPDFDWNGNGQSDAFDHYMNMNVSGSGSKDTDTPSGGGGGSRTPHSRSGAKGQKPTTPPKTVTPINGSDGETFLKSMLVTGLCIGGIVVPVMADMGPFGILVSVVISVMLSVWILGSL